MHFHQEQTHTHQFQGTTICLTLCIYMAMKASTYKRMTYLSLKMPISTFTR